MAGLELHGHTKLELFNAESGKLEEMVEDDNELTGALEEIFQGIGRFGAGDSLTQYINQSMNMYGFTRGCFNLTQWFGGLLALDKSQDKDSPFPSYDSEIIASGVYGAANIGANTIRGSYNSIESVLDWAGHELKFVYDFATSQGNGRIASICLTPWLGGYMNQGRSRTQTGISSLPVDECFQPNRYSRSGSSSGSTSSNNRPDSWLPLFGYAADFLPWFTDNWASIQSSDEYYPTNSNYMGKGIIHRILELDPANNRALRAKLELSSGKLYVTFQRYTIAGDAINVWYGNGDQTWPHDDSPTIELDALYNHMQFQYMNYDYENRILYVVAAPFDVRNYTNYNMNYACRNAVEVASNIKVYGIHVDPTISDNVETYTIDTYTVPNNTNVRLPLQPMRRGHQCRQLQFFCYDGYMYVYGPNYNQNESDTTAKNYTIYKIELAHPTNVVQIQTNITSFSSYYAVVMDAHDGRIWINFGSNVVRVLNTYTNELYSYEELLHYDYENYAIVPIRGHHALASENGHLIGIRPNVLMTVNNITPVTKTAAQTMKISYTISG